MADINQVITLGIGTPSGIPEFLTFGLQIGEAESILPTPLSRMFHVMTDRTGFIVIKQKRTFISE